MVNVTIPARRLAGYVTEYRLDQRAAGRNRQPEHIGVFDGNPVVVPDPSSPDAADVVGLVSLDAVIDAHDAWPNIDDWGSNPEAYYDHIDDVREETAAMLAGETLEIDDVTIHADK